MTTWIALVFAYAQNDTLCIITVQRSPLSYNLKRLEFFTDGTLLDMPIQICYQNSLMALTIVRSRKRDLTGSRPGIRGHPVLKILDLQGMVKMQNFEINRMGRDDSPLFFDIVELALGRVFAASLNYVHSKHILLSRRSK